MSEEIVHMCPPEGSGLMPCCGRTPFDAPRWEHRITLDASLVTCKGVTAASLVGEADT